MPYAARKIFQKNRLTIIFYHNVEPTRFQKHMIELKKHYSILPLKEAVSKIKEGSSFGMKYPLAITFDDGPTENFRLLDTLKASKIPVTIFICSQIANTGRHYWWRENIDGSIIEGLKKVPDSERLQVLGKNGFLETQEFAEPQSLSMDQINRMKESGVDFQSHTRYHRCLSHCDGERSRDEILTSRKELKEMLKDDIYAIAFPDGDYSDREISYVIEAGYEAALTVDHGFNKINADRYRLKRIGLPENIDTNELMVRTSGIWEPIRWIMEIISR